MLNLKIRLPYDSAIITAVLILALGLAFPISAMAQTGTTTDQNPSLDKSVMDTLHQCQQVASSCAATTKDAAGILVFPNVVKADLIIGGAGGKGALIENGKITGYYSLGVGSAGLQAGVESANQVFVFRTPTA